MENPRSYTGQFKQSAFVWKPDFSQRHDQVYVQRQEAGRYVESPQHPAPSRDEIINRFVQNQCQQEHDRYFYRTRLVSRFLKSSDFETLRSVPGPEGELMGPMVLIDDRNDARGVRNNVAGELRTPAGPLNPRRFFLELMKPRVTLANEADAERRLIYITDLNPTCALALAATASPRQAVFLRDFMYRYLACRTLIGIEIPFTGFPTFALEFHLPYYAWRKMHRPDIDADFVQEVEGTPIRHTEEVMYLKIKGHDRSDLQDDEEDEQGQLDYIHEAQISIMVTGIDDWFWTAYCFVDTYFKGPGHTESVEYYSSQRPPVQPAPMDPLSCGKYEANRPIWNPRHYFLRTLSTRMEQVKQEWNNVVFQLFREIDPCIYYFTRGEKDPNATSELEITQQPAFRWTIRVLRQFTQLLSKTIDSWETFKDGEIRYFNLPDSEALAQASWGRYLAAIDKDVTELKDLRSSLIHQTELFENMTNSIVTHAAHNETITTRLQSQFIQALTVITIFYLPPTLASAIFSMQTILPGHARFSHWIYVLLGLSIFTAMLVINLPHITKLIQSIRSWQGQAWAKVHKILIVRTGLQGRWRGQDPETADDGVELQDQGNQRQEAREGEV